MQESPERRRRILTMAVFILIMTALAAVDALNSESWHWRLVDQLRAGAIVLLAFVLGARSTTGFSVGAPKAALNDELTQANRASASRWGFWAFCIALAAALAAAFAAGSAWPLNLFATLMLVLVFGVAAAAIRFVALERLGA